MSLLSQIQADAIDPAVPTTVLLRKCLVLAAKLDHAPLREWVQHELSGYPDGDNVPAYRAKRSAPARGQFSQGLGAYFTGEIPQSCIPEDWHQGLFTIEFTRGVAEYESLLDSDGKKFQVPWPADATARFAEDIWANASCVQAWREVSRGTLAQLLDEVRTKVLMFALEIEAADPAAGEARPGQPPLPTEQVTQIFNTTIYGDVSNLAAGGDATQVVTQMVIPGEWDSLVLALHRAGVPTAEIDTLRAAFDQDGGQAGMEVGRWQEHIREKIRSGTLTLAAGISTSVIADLLLKFAGG
jgi:hypothetical protein